MLNQKTPKEPKSLFFCFMGDESCFFRQNQWLYHFTKSDAAKHIIQDLQLKYGKLTNTNDAYENRKTVYNEHFPLCKENLCKEIENEINHYQQISLSEDKIVFGRRGFDLQQMWGLYADKGFGICLVFDKAEFLEGIPQCCTCGPVIYNPEINSDTFTEIKEVDDIELYIRNNAKSLFFNKRKEWEHEQEYRIMKRFDDGTHDHFLCFKNSLKYIILYNAKHINNDESILNSTEYCSIKKILPKDIKVLIYSSFFGEQSLICYDNNPDGEIFWNSSERYGIISDINIDNI